MKGFVRVLAKLKVLTGFVTERENSSLLLALREGEPKSVCYGVKREGMARLFLGRVWVLRVGD